MIFYPFLMQMLLQVLQPEFMGCLDFLPPGNKITAITLDCKKKKTLWFFCFVYFTHWHWVEPRGFWHCPTEIWISNALFNVVNIIRDGTRRLKIPQRFEDGEADVLKGFLIWSLVWESWIPCVLCVWVREEWMSEGWIMQVRILLFGEGPLQPRAQRRRLCEILIHHLKVVVWMLPSL